MQFGVIYSIDAEHVRPRMRPPEKQRKARRWVRTEQGRSQHDVPGWRFRDGHEKWVALLDLAQFREFVGSVGLVPDSAETGGSLGAPTPDGWAYGALPAVCFHDDHDDEAILDAFVTPYPEPGDEAFVPGLVFRPPPWPESVWNTVRDWLLEEFR